MRQLAGTILTFALLSCAAAADVLDTEGPATATTIPEITVEGSPPVIDLDVPVAELCKEGKTCKEDPAALSEAKVSVAAPYLEVRAIDVAEEGAGSTMLAVRTAEGWRALPETFVSHSDDDPGCPSIERESAIVEVRVEQGAVVVVTASDRQWIGDEHWGNLEMSKARACREVDGELTCGEPTVVEARLSMRTSEDDETRAPLRTFSTKYWVDADGEIETDKGFEPDSLAEAAPGT
jgi:hypothetical protein